MASHVEELPISGGVNTYASGGVMNYDLTPIKSFVNYGGKKAPYVYRKNLAFTLVVSNTSGGNITLGKNKLFDFLKQCFVTTPEFSFVNLQNQAGMSLVQD